MKVHGTNLATFDDKNSTPRDSILECTFSTGLPIPITKPIASDFMTFSCTKLIYLYGFVACNQIIDDTAVKFIGASIFDSKTFEQSSIGWRSFNIKKSGTRKNGAVFFTAL